MSESFYPSISSLLKTDNIPESLSFIKSALNSVTNGLYYKNLQFCDNGSEGYYEMDIIPGNQELFDIDLFGTGLKLVINPDENLVDGNTSIHISLSYVWPVLAVIKDFSIKNFSHQGQELLDLFKKAVYIPEKQSLAIAINTFEGEKTIEAIKALVDKINAFYSLSIPYPPEGEYMEMIDDVLEKITSANIADIAGKLIAVQDIIEKFYLNISESGFLDNLKTYAEAILQQPLMDYIEQLLTPQVDGSINLALGLAFPRKWMTPLDDNGNPLPEPEQSIISFNAGELLFSTTDGIHFDEDVYGGLNHRSQIGNSGLTVDFTNAKLDLSRTTSIPEATAAGYPDDFVGVFVESAEIGLPKKWFKRQENTTLGIFGENLLLGTGGISGTFGLKAIGTDNKPVDGDIAPEAELEFELGKGSGFVVGFKHFDLTLRQGEFVSTNIKGSLTIPCFKDTEGDNAKIDISMSFDKNGDFYITAAETDGIPWEIPGVVKFIVKTLSVGRENDKFYVSTSGSIEFIGSGIIGDLFQDPLEIDQLIIWQDGTIELKGLDGAFKLPKPKTLNLGPADITVTAIHFGTDERMHESVMRKYWYFGFDGGININPGGIDARGDGVKVYFTVDNGPLHVFLRIQSLSIDLVIPGSASRDSAAVIISGYLSMKEAAEDSKGNEYIGGVDVSIPKLTLSASGNMRYNPSIPAYLVDVNLDLPTAIPLGPTGLGIYGFRGMLGQRYVASRKQVGLSDDASWYEYYKKKVSPDYREGIQVSKFAQQDGFSMGAGASLATSFDGGKVFSSKVFVLLSMPDNLFIVGKAAILSQRIGLDTTNDPPFSAMIAISDDGVEAAFGANINIPEGGEIAKVSGSVEMAFFFNNAGGWYLNIGRNQPEDKRIQAKIFTLFNAYFYFMLSKQGIAAGAGANWNFERKLGPLKISAFAYLDVAGKVGFKPVQLGGSIGLGAGASIKILGFGLGIEIHAFLAAEAPKPFIITGKFSFKIGLPWPFRKLGGPYSLEFTWSFNKNRDLSEISLIDPKYNVKAINKLTGESFPVCFSTNGNNVPAEIDSCIIPVDSFIDVEFLKGMGPMGNAETKFGAIGQGANYTELIPPQKGKSEQVMHEYRLEDIEITYHISGNNWVPYDMYGAIHPNFSPDTDSEILHPADANAFKYGFWQCETPAKYNKLRILSQSPLSYITTFTSGVPLYPENFGYKEGDFFCEGQYKTKKCITFPELGKVFASGSIREQQRILIRATGGDGKTWSAVNPYSLDNALVFGGKVELFFPEQQVTVDLRISLYGNAVRIKYFRQEKQAKTEYVEITEKIIEASSSETFHLISYKHTDHNDSGVDLVTIESIGGANRGFLLNEYSTLQLPNYLRQENNGKLLLEESATNRTKLFGICMMNNVDYNYNQHIKTQEEITEGSLTMRENFTTVTEPIWRPDTVYRIKITTNDVLVGERNYLNDYYFFFKTAGPVGHFHQHNATYKLLEDKKREDQFRLATLRPYIDYSRSYPNADGRLTNAKPLFYKEPKLLMFYKQNTIHAMFNNFSEYGSKAAITSELRVLIKDPTEPVSINIDDYTATVSWKKDSDPSLTPEVRMINNLAMNGANCSGFEEFTPLSVVQEITTKELKPDKLYTALFNAVYKPQASTSEAVTQVHSYVFKTSQYADFKQQIQSCILQNNNGEEKRAVFNVEKTFDVATISDASKILQGTFPATDQLTTDYAGVFDRLINGVLKLGVLPPAVTTDFNIIKNTETGNIIGIIVRNPEPFNDPKIPESDLSDTIQLSVNDTATGSYKAIFSQDKTQAFISNTSLNIPSGSATFTFRYKEYGIDKDAKKNRYTTKATETVTIDV